MATVVIASVIATKCRNGGNAAAILNWIQGFRKLGLRTYFIEQIQSQHCTDGCGRTVPFESSENLDYFSRVMKDAGMENASALICTDDNRTSGLSYRDLLDVAEGADLLLNVTGHLTLVELLRRLRRKAYLDLDPGYTQFWHASGQAPVGRHDFYFTIGENIGTPACGIPTSGIEWRHTRHPIALDALDDGDAPQWNGRLTTVASWRGPYGPVRYGANTFGLKVHEFRKFIELPRLAADTTFEVALDIDPADAADLRSLHQHGWTLVDPRRCVPDPLSFDAYIRGSDAEWSVAQGVYVATNSGWMSDRTIRYLAAGKPAIVQDTGAGRTYPVGEGLVTFQTLEGAVRAVRAVAHDPRAHQDAARELARTYFDSERVLGRLLDEVGVAA